MEERFESNRWLDRLLIEQLETSDNGLHQRSQDESDEIAKEAENLRVRHEMGDMLGEDVRTEYRQLRKRQARAKEVVRREPFRRDRATLNVMDDYTTGTRRPEESSDPRRIMGVYHEFNEMLSALLPLLDVEKEELPRAMVTASEHLTEMLELADRVELYSDDPIFKVIKRKEISDLIYALEAGGRAKVVQGELMEKSDLGGWDQESKWMMVRVHRFRPWKPFWALTPILFEIESFVLACRCWPPVPRPNRQPGVPRFELPQSVMGSRLLRVG